MSGFIMTFIICVILGIVARGYEIKRDIIKGTLLGGGVCAGIAKIFKIDPFWIRLAFVLSVIFFGFGGLLYVILWLLLESE